MARYRCKHCGKVVERSQRKAWIKSFCTDSGRTVHLMRTSDRPEATFQLGPAIERLLK